MNLLDFVKNKMRMSHLYQPVMIKALLLNKGKLPQDQIASNILNYDNSQIEYYTKVVNNMVGKVLRNHKIVTKNKKNYELCDYHKLSEIEIEEIIKECENKINEYNLKRGDTIWEHRRRSRRPVPGSIRYRVLKRAHHRCELCGISADEKALEVDHIVPKSLGGADSINNYQALCYTCNAQKKDLDETDFRNLEAIFNLRRKDCVFCSYSKNDIVFENNLSFAIFDKFPVSEHHLLIIPKRHVNNYFELLQAELNSISQIIQLAKDELDRIDTTIAGYNIGTNIGEHAGQTIFHCHIHMIPRRKNDKADPVGGIRQIFPTKANYKDNP